MREIADIISVFGNDKDRLVDAFIELLKRSNPNFDEERFIRACNK